MPLKPVAFLIGVSVRFYTHQHQNDHNQYDKSEPATRTCRIDCDHSGVVVIVQRLQLKCHLFSRGILIFESLSLDFDLIYNLLDIRNGLCQLFRFLTRSGQTLRTLPE